MNNRIAVVLLCTLFFALCITFPSLKCGASAEIVIVTDAMEESSPDANQPPFYAENLTDSEDFACSFESPGFAYDGVVVLPAIQNEPAAEMVNEETAMQESCIGGTGTGENDTVTLSLNSVQTPGDEAGVKPEFAALNAEPMPGAYIIPEFGGSGDAPYYISGLFIIACASMILLKERLAKQA